MPKQLMAPDLYSLCHQYQDERFGTTFIQRLHQATTPVVAWLQANNISVDRPNETRDEKRARQNRDAQRRFRERQSGQGDPAVQAAYDQWQSEIAERKRVMAELDLLVKDAQENFMKTCDQRRHMKETLDNCVARAKADYDALKNNPQPEG
jgi:hypothetical protein